LSGSIAGSLQGGKWKKVTWGWGWYSISYGASTSARGSKFRCYTAPIPWPISSGNLPNQVTLRVIGYGDIWLFSPTTCQYQLVPVGP
jgi:hypothetical protein